jgi:hypothetical protein
MWKSPDVLSTAPDPLVSIRITPEPCCTIWRAAACPVTYADRAPEEIGARKSSTSISSSGVPWTSPREDEVEGDVEAARLLDDRRHERADRGGVERVDDRDVRAAAVGGDVGGDGLERGAGAAGEVDRRPFAGEGPGDAAAETTGGAVDDRVLACEECAHAGFNDGPAANSSVDR